MSAGAEELQRKIAIAGDLESVVRSMKALAASSIGQYEKAVEALEAYSRTVELGLSACLRGAPPIPSPPRSASRDGRAIGAVVFGSDQGLVGRFNEVLLEFATRELDAFPGRRMIWAVGERIHALVPDSDLKSARLLPVPTSVHAITALVGRILIEIQAARDTEQIGEVHLFHNRPGAGAINEPVGQRLLPLDERWRDRFCARPWPTKRVPDVIEGDTPTLQAFVRGYLFVRLFQASAESLAGENASRLASMQRAEKNIQDLLVELKRRFHRVRQQSIDEELFDVIAGYEATAKANG